MKEKLTNKLIPNLIAEDSTYKVWDTEITGFFLRVASSGTKTYCLNYRFEGLGRDYTLGRHGNITLTIARELAKTALGEVAKGTDIQSKKKQLKERNQSLKYETLGGFITHKYTNWVTTERKTGDDTLKIIKRDFSYLYKKSMNSISAWDLTKWRTDKLKGEKGKPLTRATVNRRLSALKAVFSKAVEWGVIAQNPLASLKPLKLESDQRIRYLSTVEEKRLRKALDTRQNTIVKDRKKANQWREIRDYELLPNLSNNVFVDHIKPMTLLALNTGMRRGEIFQLRWENVDLNGKTLTVVASSAKSGKTRHIPLNDEALGAMIHWSNQTSANGLVFPSSVTGKEFNNIKKAWKSLLTLAEVEDFRFHDLRHHFASKLVMGGVDLNTVRELLGHSSIDMTLRYAHLAPEHKANAVAVLNLTS
jgi:integrase